MCNENQGYKLQQSDWPINSQTMIDLTIEMISLTIYAGETNILHIYIKSISLSSYYVQRNAKNDFTYCVYIWLDNFNTIANNITWIYTWNDADFNICNCKREKIDKTMYWYDCLCLIIVLIQFFSSNKNIHFYF